MTEQITIRSCYGGEIRIPAIVMGMWGLHPSYGEVPTHAFTLTHIPSGLLMLKSNDRKALRESVTWLDALRPRLRRIRFDTNLNAVAHRITHRHYETFCDWNYLLENIDSQPSTKGGSHE